MPLILVLLSKRNGLRAKAGQGRGSARFHARFPRGATKDPWTGTTVPVPSWVTPGSPTRGSGWPPSPTGGCSSHADPKMPDSPGTATAPHSLPPQSPVCSIQILFGKLQALNSKSPKCQGDMQGVGSEMG